MDLRYWMITSFAYNVISGICNALLMLQYGAKTHFAFQLLHLWFIQ